MFEELTTDQKKALKMSLECQQDFIRDTILEELPYVSSAIRRLNEQSDEYINDELNTMRKNTYDKIDQLVAISTMLQHLK